MSSREWNQDLEESLELFAQLVGEDGRLEREFATSQRGFATPDLPAAERLLAERRHLEWFLCERPSESLEGVPAEALREPWEERAEASQVGFAEALLGSVASAFEVTAIAPGGSLLVRDLFGFAELEITEPEAAGELAVGDLLVGRLFPVSSELFRLSPATGVFRNQALVAALRGDVERMRGGRSRVLRMQQCELEALFFGRAPSGRVGDARDGSPPGVEDEASLRSAASRELIDAGLDAARAADSVARVLGQASGAHPAAAAGRDPVGELLNELAFDTEVDLELARRTLIRLRSELGARPAPAGAPSRARPEGTESAASALRHFDEGRARGEELEVLFRRLETELGVEADEPTDDGTSPDFPGVIGAMVEEYLWDREREGGEVSGSPRELLRELSRYGKGIGVFENLASRDLLDFAGRWLLEESRLETAVEARALLDTLADFCRWAEERHAHALWSGFGTLWKELYEDVPRLFPLRPTLLASEPDADAYEVEAIRPDGVTLLLGDDGSRVEVSLAEEVHRRLRPGDLLRLATRPEGTLPCRVYPGVLRELLRAGGRPS